VHIERQLLRDILSCGGLKLCKLSRVCDRKPDAYGHKGSVERRRIQNLVTRWKRLHHDHFEALALQHSLTGTSCLSEPNRITISSAIAPTPFASIVPASAPPKKMPSTSSSTSGKRSTGADLFKSIVGESEVYGE
jgi:hypothetical protein